MLNRLTAFCLLLLLFLLGFRKENDGTDICPPPLSSPIHPQDQGKPPLSKPVAPWEVKSELTYVSTSYEIIYIYYPCTVRPQSLRAMILQITAF